MSRVRTRGTEAPAAEEMSYRAENSSVFYMSLSLYMFSFQMWLESGDGSGTSVTGDREFQTTGAVILIALDWQLILVAGWQSSSWLEDLRVVLDIVVPAPGGVWWWWNKSLSSLYYNGKLQSSRELSALVAVIVQQLISYRQLSRFRSLQPRPDCPVGLALWVASDGFDSWTDVLRSVVWQTSDTPLETLGCTCIYNVTLRCLFVTKVKR